MENQNTHSYVHLHNHTEYSLLDGAIRINELIDKTAEFGMDSVAITDHGNMFGCFHFYETARKNDIKPIIGCEAYICNSDNPKQDKNKEDSYHLVLLAKDKTGYSNLIDLVTNSYIDGFYSKPLIRKSYLEGRTRGLIALSACLKGEISSNIIKNRDEKTILSLADYYRNQFPGGDFYLEIQDNGLDLQNTVNKVLVEISRKTQIPLVATNDVHFLNKEDWDFHNALLCIGTAKNINSRDRLVFPDTLYFKSPREMWESFRDVPQALKNTVEISEKCNFDFETGNYHLPVFPIPEGYDTDSFLEYKANEGFERKISSKSSFDPRYPLNAYRERLDYELSVISKLNFSGYMLIVWDIIDFCRKNRIGVGPGRGSAVGSLLCYCLDITEVDPMPFDLIFERFLNPERISMPDIDIDICQEKRINVINYLSEKYGTEHVAQIITFSKLTSKAAIKDVARVYELPFDKANELTKMFPDGASDIENALSISDEFRNKVEEDETLKKIIENSRKVEGLTRHVSLHAAGIVIADRPVSSYLPLYTNQKTPICTQFEYRQLEKLGLLKMDLLGLKNITLIDKIVEAVDKKLGIKIDIKNIPLDDKKTFELISSGRTCGVFQIEGDGMQALITQAKPDKFIDIMPLLALYRPGPLGQKMNDVYVSGKRGHAKVIYDIDALEDILSETYGVILYQEQVMKIANVIGGFTLSEADMLRKAMGKKQQDIMEKMKPKFISNAIARGYPRKAVKELFTKMERFAEYGFNKSHSAGYSFITYRIAYLKANYPAFFFAASMSLDSSDKTRILKFINDCRSFNIDIVPPDINISEEDFTVDSNKIIFGLRAIQNVGRNAISAILQSRETTGNFDSLEHFCSSVNLSKVNKRVLESLIKSGAFDNVSGCSRNEMLHKLDRIISKKPDRNSYKQRTLLQAAGKEKPEDIQREIIQPETHMEKLKYEYESLSYFISGHPISGYEKILKKTGIIDIITILSDDFQGENFRIAGVINSIEVKKTKRNKNFARITFEDTTGICSVIVFPEIYEQKQDILRPVMPLVITGTKDSQDGSNTVIARDICLMDRYIENRIEFIDLLIDYDTIKKDMCCELEQIISRFSGDTMLRFIIMKKDKKITIRLHPNYRVRYDRDLFSSISGLLDQDEARGFIFRMI